MKNKKAVIYARQSAGAEDFSESVENQIQNCRKLAEKEGLTVIGEFSDLNTSGKTYPTGAETIADNDSAFQKWFEQQTGDKMFRPGLGEVFFRLQEISYIIVDDMTRLYRPVSRSFLENYVNNALAGNGVEVIQVKGGKIDLTKFDQSLIQMLKNQINDEQIANQKAKSMQQFKKLRDRGIFPNGTSGAFGIIYHKEDKRLEIDTAKQEVIKYIYDEIEKYTSYTKIIQTVNTTEKWKKLFFNGLSDTLLRNISTNPIYCAFLPENWTTCIGVKRPVY